jgi:hypothetical protein
MRPEEFVARVQATAMDQGVPFRRLRQLKQAEAAHVARLAQLKGYSAIVDAFSCFVLETVEGYNATCRPAISVPVSADYLMFLQRFSHNFSSICAAQLIASNGYPLHGYTLLRNTFDNVIMTSAACQTLITFLEIERLEGIATDEVRDQSKIRGRRKLVERRVQRITTGANSGLSQSRRCKNGMTCSTSKRMAVDYQWPCRRNG